MPVEHRLSETDKRLTHCSFLNVNGGLKNSTVLHNTAMSNKLEWWKMLAKLTSRQKFIQDIEDIYSALHISRILQRPKYQNRKYTMNAKYQTHQLKMMPNLILQKGTYIKIESDPDDEYLSRWDASGQCECEGAKIDSWPFPTTNIFVRGFRDRFSSPDLLYKLSYHEGFPIQMLKLVSLTGGARVYVTD